MEIPNEDENAREGRTDYFPYYTRLPPEVRGIILGELISTADKLSVLIAIPSEMELMKWDVLGSLVLPKIIQLGFLDWRDILNLSRANDQLQNAFKQNIKSENYYSLPSAHITDLTLFLSENNCNLSPLPVKVKIPNNFFEEPNWLPTVERIGSRIWDCSVSLAGMSRWRQFDTARKCFLAMPNLRRVKVEYRLHTEDERRKVFTVININREFPIPGPPALLPRMTHLRFLEMAPRFYSPFWVELLSKYSQQLRTISITDCNETLLSCSAFPNLVNLRLEGRYTSNVLTTLNSFVGSPLQTISMKFFRIHEPQFLELMRILSIQFGKSLEELTLSQCKSGMDDCPDSGWEADMSFFKIKRLTFIGCLPIGWNILLHSPALQRLILRNQNFPAHHFRDDSHILELSRDKDKMLESNVWSLVPSLKSIEFNKWKPNAKLESSYRVTRKQSLAIRKRSTASCRLSNTNNHLI